jgi:hypothetical protein
MEGLRPILTVASQADFAEALRLRRLAIGLTQMDVDHIAGFHDGYAAHLERPFTRTGRRSFKLSPMGVIWLQTLGLKLAVVESDCSICAVSPITFRTTLTDRDANPAPRPG